ncbi:hypothetical protein ABLB90_14800 [Photorhabdus bodei]|uniref:hypothetical protein n=1 Tax=Photorhabdus bodei TaxID=2029681 RepID=UPI0032B70ACD
MTTFLWVLGTIIVFSIGTYATTEENKKLKEQAKKTDEQLKIQDEQLRIQDNLIKGYKSDIETLKNGFLLNFKSEREFQNYLKTLSDDELWELQMEVESYIDKRERGENDDNDIEHNVDVWNESQSNEFKENLSIIWADSPISVEFSYRDLNNNRSRRNVLLNEVSINSEDEPYFNCFCMNASDNRIFKVKRITSKIQYAGKKYSKEEFFNDI